MNRWIALLLGFVLMGGFAGCDKGTPTTGGTPGKTGDASKDAAANKENIIGTWELTTQERGGAPIGTLFEFTRDGKVLVSGKNNEKKEIATYEVTADKLRQTFKEKDNVEKTITFQIKTLTSRDLVVVRDNKMEEAFKKK
jgi:uncharacterized protein (TIGR03066 family)